MLLPTSVGPRRLRTHSCVARRETLLDTPMGDGLSVGTGRRHECRRGTHECVRHLVTLDWSDKPRARVLPLR